MSESKLRGSLRKDLAIYVAISSAAILWLIIGIGMGLSFGWIILWIGTAFIFVGFAVVRRPLWSKSFWLFVAVCLLLHVALVMPRFARLLDQTPHGAAGLFIACVLVEYGFLLIASAIVFSRRRPRV